MNNPGENSRTVEFRFEADKNYFMREAFNALRTNVLFCGTSVHTIAVTSCYAHEGKTTVSAEIARSLAEAGRHVLFIDADLRKSTTVGRYTDAHGITGLSQLLSGQATLEETIYHTQMPALDVIFAGPFPPNPAEMAGGEPFRQMVREVSGMYDYVIIDTPPLGMVIDAAEMATVCDGVVLVINRGNVRYRVAQNVIAQLKKSGCRILGAVLNRPNKSSRKGIGYRGVYDQAEK